MLLSGRVALVTGASRGIGRAIALALAEEGADLVVNYSLNKSKAEETSRGIRKMGRGCISVKADVSKREEVEYLREACLAEFQGVDILVNNAGIHQHLKIWELDPSDWERVINVNLTGAYLCSKAFVPEMKMKRYGRIINISSIVGFTGTDHEIHYAASKAGIVGFTKSLARELGPYNITVNAIAPGTIRTDMTLSMTREEEERLLKEIPLGRIGIPEDIANAAVFLASDKASYVTGETLHVNGGLLMH